jgi:hypothetical protein
MWTLIGLIVLLQTVPGLVVEPDQPGASAHWTVSLTAPYCGGYGIGDGVYVRPEPPLTLPDALPDGSVLFQGRPASASIVGDAVRIGPAPDTVFAQVCQTGERPLTVELLADAGLALPAEPGSYAVDVWTGARPDVTVLPVEVASVDEE